MTDRDQNPIQEAKAALERRNRFLGLSLFVFVIVLGVVTYFRIKGLTP